MTNDDDAMLQAERQQGEYAPAGEGQGTSREFTAAEIADAFSVKIDRAERAIAGEYGAHVAAIDSRRAQELAEFLLADLPLADRQAALMKLGAFVPRADHMDGLGEKHPDEESDRLQRTADRADGERGGR